MYKPGKLPSEGAPAVSCEICSKPVMPNDAALLTCLNLPPNDHKLTVHDFCAAEYAAAEAAKFKKSQRLSAICVRLQGGGAKAGLVSNTVLKTLGLTAMLDATCTGRTKGSLVGGNGKMAQGFLRRANEVVWHFQRKWSSLSGSLCSLCCPDPKPQP